MRAALLDEIEANVEMLRKDLEAAKTESDAAIEEATVEAKARGAARVVADFKSSEEFVSALH